jgi:hypothetical protein
MLKETCSNAEILLDTIWQKVFKFDNIQTFYKKGLTNEDVFCLDSSVFDGIKVMILNELEKANGK